MHFISKIGFFVAEIDSFPSELTHLVGKRTHQRHKFEDQPEIQEKIKEYGKCGHEGVNPSKSA